MSNRFVLISCVSKKLSRKARAKNLYISPLFRFNLAFAYSLKPDKIFILSAKHGLVDLEQKLRPYEQTLNKMSALEIKKWSKKVSKQMQGKIDFENDNIIFLAGEKYRRYLLHLFQKANVPLQGLSIGKQLQYLKNKINHAK